MHNLRDVSFLWYLTEYFQYCLLQLPEPLLTFDLYNDFITVGKAIQHLNDGETSPETNEIMDITDKLQKLLHRLPPYCYSTLQHLISHLQRWACSGTTDLSGLTWPNPDRWHLLISTLDHWLWLLCQILLELSLNLSHVFIYRVSENYENKMSPSNLGIVFGPTLLRPLVSTDMSMIALLETTYQAVLVEFLITHHDKIFGLEQRSDTPPPPPTAPLPDTPPRGSCPLDGVAYLDSENETTSRERPRSVEVSTSVRFKHLWLIFNCSFLSSHLHFISTWV